MNESNKINEVNEINEFMSVKTLRHIFKLNVQFKIRNRQQFCSDCELSIYLTYFSNNI